MIDRLFIEEMIERANAARDKAGVFNRLSLAQLSWKPNDRSWSIGQCLDHLIISDCAYFPVFEKIAEGKYHMSFWEQWSPFGWLFGRVLLNQLRETQKRKTQTPRKLEPTHQNIDAVILERFHKHLDTLISYTARFATKNIDRIHITSPVYNFVTYSLRKTIHFLMEHEHRHLNQALRVMESKEFPAQ